MAPPRVLFRQGFGLNRGNYLDGHNASTGALLPIAGSPFAAGTGPWSVTADITGNFAYVATGSGVSAFTINASTGALTAVLGSSFAAGAAPVSVITTGKIQ